MDAPSKLKGEAEVPAGRVRPRSASKLWVRAEQTLGRRAAMPAIFCGAVQIVFAIAQAGCAARLLAAIVHRAPGAPIALCAAGFGIAALARAGCGLAAERLGFESGAAARRRLRHNVLASLLAHGASGAPHSAALGATAVDGVEAMDGFFARWIPATSLATIGPALILIAAVFVDWRAALILLVAGLAVPFAMAFAGIGAGVAAKGQFVAMTRLQTRFLDRIRGISTIILAGRAADEAGALRRAADELRARTMRVLRVAFLSSSALDLAAAAALIAILVRFAGPLRADPALAGTALFMLLLVPEFFAPLRGFAAVYADRLAVEAVAEDFAALPPTPAPVPAADIRSLTAKGVTLAFETVGFTWDEARGPVLRDLSFRVGSGELLLLTGASGAGKSTILDLILGFIEPGAGRITINGAEISTLVPAARTRMLGWIGQRPMIFAGTIEENIRFGRPEAGADELAEAIENARLTELIARLPRGLKTELGEGGYGLSGGQAQRVAIARAFLKDAPVLLLDEPTAHLDPATEQDVLESLKTLAAGRTVILASHSALAAAFARDTGAKRLDLDALRQAGQRVTA
jgi:ATP-binding cassette subfamily C protein CydD